MITAVLVWIGVVLALALLLTMALGPAIVQIDSKLYERKQRRADDEGDGFALTERRLRRPAL